MLPLNSSNYKKFYKRFNFESDMTEEIKFGVTKAKNPYEEEVDKWYSLTLKGGGDSSVSGMISEVNGDEIVLNPYVGTKVNRKTGCLVLQLIHYNSKMHTYDIIKMDETTRRGLLDYCYGWNKSRNPRLFAPKDLVKKSNNLRSFLGKFLPK